MQNTVEEQTIVHRPVLAAFSISIAVLVALIWVASVAGIYFGFGKASAAMVIMGTIPVALVGTAAAIYALIARQENKHIVQYGLWTNGLLAFFAFPVMVIVLLGIAG
jgi:multidrug efflux pump subunit AcrB